MVMVEAGKASHRWHNIPVRSRTIGHTLSAICSYRRNGTGAVVGEVAMHNTGEAR